MAPDPQASATAATGDAAKRAAPKPYPFWLGGGAACISACCTHPLDVAKTRLQTAKTRVGMASTVVHAAKTEGLKGIYTGLSASLLRQMTYSVTRFGVYDYLKGQVTPDVTYKNGRRQEHIPAWKIAAAASLAGAAGGIAGNPADIVLVRMTSDINKKPEQRYAYRNAVVGLYRMLADEGVGAFFRGMLPNTLRAVLMNASQLATYDLAKDALLATGSFQDGMPLHFSASFIAGTVATTVCSPADVVKARVMNASKDTDQPGSLLYRLRLAIQREGVSFLFRGWTPAWIRLAPNTIIMFMTLEKLRTLVDISREKRGMPSKRTAQGATSSS